jgi:anthranilate synthase/aminodeoxychorismate synthase-like glutamine amidotransferase
MILVIDNYDSFTYNLVDYLGKVSEHEIKVYRNDALSVEDVKEMKPDYIVISPGPKEPKDAGISKQVIEQLGPTIPTLGVCLGHQSIGEVFGGKTVRAKNLMHGKTSSMSHTGHPLFSDIASPFTATRYHSLVIDESTFPSDALTVIARSDDDNEIMAVVHKHYPIYGLQFHPESICSPDGLKMLENFLGLHS